MNISKMVKKTCSRSNVSLVAICFVAATSLSSCNEAVWQGLAMGLTGVGGYSDTSYASYTSSSSSVSSSNHTCKRCGGSGQCQTCGGSGKVYDYGTTSIVTKQKYARNCGVCSGKGRCGVCNGKGTY